MKIIKKGKIIPFICKSCDCQFAVGIHSIESYDGNWYSKCPMCGWECHTDIAWMTEYEKEMKKDDNDV